MFETSSQENFDTTIILYSLSIFFDILLSKNPI